MMEVRIGVRRQFQGSRIGDEGVAEGDCLAEISLLPFLGRLDMGLRLDRCLSSRQVLQIVFGFPQADDAIDAALAEDTDGNAVVREDLVGILSRL